MNNNITLIGMPGCGKSTGGIVLAKILGYDFIDSDLLIQKQEGRLLSEIINEDGLETFIKIEEQVNMEIVDSHAVIAPGGSVIYGKGAMEHLKGLGTILYIKLSYDTIVERLGDLETRGVVLKEEQSLKTLYDERCPLYEYYADIIIEGDGMSVEELLETMVTELKRHK